jgi:hypothetical protein
MRFGVHAEMTVDVPDSLKCGYLRVQGRQFPPKGPRSGTGVLWFTTGELERHGTVSADRVTNGNGDAFLTFTPKNERFPGFGAVKPAAGDIFARTPGNAYIPTSSVRTTWFVESHVPGFKFSGLKWRVVLCNPPDVCLATFEVTHARKCGDDPFGANWVLILHEVTDWPGGAGPGYHYNGPRSAHWKPGERIVIEDSPIKDAPIVNLAGTPPSSLQASVADDEPAMEILSGGPVRVEEDLDKGAFKWSCSEVGS